MRFTAGRDTTNRAVSQLPSPSQEPTVEVPLTSLDHLLQATGSTPLVWKVDVEGYEPEVLRGAAAALQQPHLRAVLWKQTPPPCSAPWKRQASPASAITSSAACSAQHPVPPPPAATTSSGSATSPSCRSASVRRRRCG